jgi:hypothetical protein
MTNKKPNNDPDEGVDSLEDDIMENSLDVLLIKIHYRGMNSLNAHEREFLSEAADYYKKKQGG